MNECRMRGTLTLTLPPLPAKGEATHTMTNDREVASSFGLGHCFLIRHLDFVSTQRQRSRHRQRLRCKPLVVVPLDDSLVAPKFFALARVDETLSAFCNRCCGRIGRAWERSKINAHSRQPRCPGDAGRVRRFSVPALRQFRRFCRGTPERV